MKEEIKANNKSKKPVIGIYAVEKIGCKEIYIGQSINIEKRLYSHAHSCKEDWQVKFHWYPELFKTFVLEKCEIDDLNDKENYWMDYYEDLGYKLYNIKRKGYRWR